MVATFLALAATPESFFYSDAASLFRGNTGKLMNKSMTPQGDVLEDEILDQMDIENDKAVMKKGGRRVQRAKAQQASARETSPSLNVFEDSYDGHQEMRLNETRKPRKSQEQEYFDLSIGDENISVGQKIKSSFPSKLSNNYHYT
ncbi:hypothetical protein YC2023_098438 [Brassica napus]